MKGSSQHCLQYDLDSHEVDLAFLSHNSFADEWHFQAQPFVDEVCMAYINCCVFLLHRHRSLFAAMPMTATLSPIFVAKKTEKDQLKGFKRRREGTFDERA